MSENNSSQVNKIILKVKLDRNNVPEKLFFRAPQSNNQNTDKEVKAFFLSLFEPETSDTLKIDLWTKEMRTVEMHKFMYNTILSMGRSYAKAIMDADVVPMFDAFANSLLAHADEKKNA